MRAWAASPVQAAVAFPVQGLLILAVYSSYRLTFSSEHFGFLLYSWYFFITYRAGLILVADWSLQQIRYVTAVLSGS